MQLVNDSLARMRVDLLLEMQGDAGQRFQVAAQLLSVALMSLGLALPFRTVHAAELLVHEAKAVATVPGQPVAAAYMVLSSKEDAELVSMSSDAAARVEIHRMDKQGDISRMRRVETLALTAGETIRLAPGECI